MIPKIIHYCWFGGKDSEKLTKCLESWKRVLPDYKIIRHDESNTEFDDYTQFLYDNKKYEFVSDIVRLKVLKESAGIYLDADMLFVKPIPHDILNHKFFIGAENEGTVAAGIIGVSEPNNPLILKWLSTYDGACGIPDDANVRTITKILRDDYGFTRIKKEKVLDGDILILPRTYFYPIYFRPNAKNYITDKSLAIHLWTGNWCNDLAHSISQTFEKYQNEINEFIERR